MCIEGGNNVLNYSFRKLLLFVLLKMVMKEMTGRKYKEEKLLATIFYLVKGQDRFSQSQCVRHTWELFVGTKQSNMWRGTSMVLVSLVSSTFSSRPHKPNIL